MQKSSDKPIKLNYITAFKYLGKYMKGHKLRFVAFYIGWLLDSAAAVIAPIIFGMMINEIVYYKDTAMFMRLSLVFVVLTIFNCIMYYLIYQVYAYNWIMFILGIKRDVFQHMYHADAQYMSNANTGELINKVQWYTSECMHLVVRNLVHTVNNALIVIFCTIYIFIISWQVGLLMLVIVPVAVIVSIKFGKKIRHYGDKRVEYFNSYIGWIFEILASLRDIRFLGAQKRADRKFVKNHKKLFKVNIDSGLSSMHAQNVINVVNTLIQMAIFTFIALFAANAGITIGLIVVIVTYFGMLTSNVQNLSGSYFDAQNRISYIQNIYDFMHCPTEEKWGGKNDLIVKDGNIQIENIKFAYDKGNKVLDNLSLNINPGDRFALVGKSGCGKTTLAYMLIGFYIPQDGTIKIDGQDLRDCSLKSIRNNIGIVQQDVLIFDGTIKENILLGKPNATDDEIILACKNAGIYNFIEELPDGINTVIGSNGVGVSGGQKQRIAIARIYLKDPKIIIFDEATSSLDSETEEQIHEAWKSILSGRTSIIIAHRQSSVMLCEKAAIIDDGKICEIGTPNNMVQNSKNFKTLFAVKESEGDA